MNAIQNDCFAIDDLDAAVDPSSDLVTPFVAAMLSNRSRYGGDNSTKSCKIMIVDDEEFNVMVFKRFLRDAGYQNVVATSDATSAMDLLARERPDIVLLDIVMPGINGLEILAKISSDVEWEQLPVLILTASQDDAIKQVALDLGAKDFLTKPVTASDLIPRVRNSLLNKLYKDRLASHATELEKLVRKRTEELAWSRQEVVFCLARAAEFRDTNTGHHVVRVGRYVGVIARRLNYDPRTSQSDRDKIGSPQQIELLELASQLHDIGKIGVPDHILKKPDKLTAEEFAVIKKHCNMGLDIIGPLATESAAIDSAGRTTMACHSPLLLLAAKIASSHHERWDGKGYPSGLKGEDIPLEGRMTAVADVFDALSTERPYKDAFSVDECLKLMEEGRGTQFDPRILDAFIEAIPEILHIRDELKDE
jgi:putative two-component system response regulator